MDTAYDIDSVDRDRDSARRTKGNVQNRALFRRVDGCAGEHFGPLLFEFVRTRQLGEHPKRLLVDPLAGKVNPEIGRCERELLGAITVGEQVSNGQSRQTACFTPQRSPDSAHGLFHGVHANPTIYTANSNQGDEWPRKK